MSAAPENPQLSPKSDVRQKPPVPTKPSNNTSETSSAETTASQSSGNVKKIVDIFSQPESKIPCGGIANITRLEKKPQQPPTIKPRQKPTSSSQTNAAKDAPPLPPKTRQNHSAQKEDEENKEVSEASRQDGGLAAVMTDGGRSGTVPLVLF